MPHNTGNSGQYSLCLAPNPRWRCDLGDSGTNNNNVDGSICRYGGSCLEIGIGGGL